MLRYKAVPAPIFVASDSLERNGLGCPTKTANMIIANATVLLLS